MKQRLLQFFILGTLPWIFLLALVTNLLLRDIFANGEPNNWVEASTYTYGIQSLVGLLAVGFLLSVERLSNRVVEPFDYVMQHINDIASAQPFQNPRTTGLADLDKIISALHVTAGDARRRLDAERTLAADVSHQLRSPLTALSLRLEQISLDTENSKVHEDAEAALNQVDRLVRLVEGLLTTWRTTSDRDLSPIDVTGFVESNAARWQTRFSANGRKLEIDCKLNLVALGTREVQDLVMSVLLENSLQHGAGVTRISAKDYQTWVLIEVSDEGDGISEEIQSSLMSQGSTTGGNGLGLAWARNQVASDGGRLELRATKPAVFGIFLMSANHIQDEAQPSELVR